jgi:uncharacterized damage-inducible protein DinB
MITPEHVKTFARYNQWQNQSLFRAAGSLSDSQRLEDRGSFFGSIFSTLNHLLWGDRIWLSRFDQCEAPIQPSIQTSCKETASWEELCSAREAMDQIFLDWSVTITTEDIQGDLTWFSGAANREVSKPKAFLICHIFNHQTHHRGQVHAMLTAAGAKPGDTDLFFLPE